ncbi:hypothetical protein [Actinacidiphila sp. bgisy144]|uniref:hypothetical protein n=1 Tax=Actinacidiphila sp. bgisy144 TaxID=3413791 RepID=UPI003EBC4C45
MTATATLTRPTTERHVLLELRLDAGDMRALGRLHAITAAADAGVRLLRLVSPPTHPQLTALWTHAVTIGMAVEITNDLTTYRPTRPADGAAVVVIGGDGRARLTVDLAVDDLLDGTFDTLLHGIHHTLHAVNAAATVAP